MTASSKWCLIVYTLWNQLLLELSLDLINTLKLCHRHIEEVHEEVWCRKNIFWQTYRVFNYLQTTASSKLWLIVHTFKQSVCISACGRYQVSRTYYQVSLLSKIGRHNVTSFFIGWHLVLRWWQRFSVHKIAVWKLKKYIRMGITVLKMSFGEVNWRKLRFTAADSKTKWATINPMIYLPKCQFWRQLSPNTLFSNCR